MNIRDAGNVVSSPQSADPPRGTKVFDGGLCKRAQLQAWNPWTLARQVSRLAARHETVQAWMKDEGKHGRCNAAGHKAITPTLKIIHKGQSSFMASFLDKNKRGGGGGLGFCGEIQGREGVA